VRLLERRHDAEQLGVDDDSVPNADRLLEEVERFLRDQ
ncbi:MAG: PAC2 family protein, partial [Microthrixaceae bacterium]|nr:PAC2 family protein [Microthrixaceae bacterium]